MSAQRDETLIVISQEVQPTLPTEITPEERAQRKAKLITMYDRGVLHDRLHVDLPPEMYGEWVRKDGFEIDAMRAKGFTDGSEYVKSRTLHHDGTTPGIGDVTFMVTPRWNKELLDEIRQEAYVDRYGKKGDKIGKEEQEFAVNAQAAGIQPMLNSSYDSTTLSDADRAIREMASQTPS